jgi:cell division protein FtsL
MDNFITKDIIFVGLFVMCVILFVLVVSSAVKYLIGKHEKNYFHSESSDTNLTETDSSD